MQDVNALDDGGIVAGMMDLSFNRFITLSVIKVLYVLGLLLLALFWLVALIGSLWNGVGSFLFMLIIGPVVLAVYAIFYRVWLELIVVVFRIGENTRKLVELQSGGVAGPGAGPPAGV